MVGRFEGRGRAVWVFERDFMVFFGWELFLFSIMPQSFSCVAQDICLFVRRQFIDKG